MTDEDMTYDEALRRLEDLVAQLERGGKNLDETLAMFEEGTALLKRCQAELGEVEGRLPRTYFSFSSNLNRGAHGAAHPTNWLWAQKRIPLLAACLWPLSMEVLATGDCKKKAP